jgi:hypothetical protein
MAEWLKNICFSPFKYGLNGINIMAMNAVSVIFNMCGKRLFKLESDKIIRNNEYKDDKDIFYMFPLHFQQMEQDVGLNMIKIENGIINDLVISIPWKELLIKPTSITVESINLTITFMQNQKSIYINSLENTNSYFFSSKNKIGENQDLLNAYKEINSLLSQYFNKINLEINTIEINVSEYFKIKLNGINYSSGIVNIDNLSIYLNNETEHELITIKKIFFDIENNNLKIHKIFVDSTVVNYIPQYYTDNTNRAFEFNVSIDFFQMDELHIDDVSVYINSDIITIKKISRANIADFLILVTNDSQSNNNFIVYDMSQNICSFCENINLKISNFNGVIQWLERTKKIISSFTNKIIVIELDDSEILESQNKLRFDENSLWNLGNLPKSRPMQFKNILSNIIYGDDLFSFCIENLVNDDDVQAHNIKIMYENTYGFIRNITFYQNGNVTFSDSNVKSNNFRFVSNESKIVKNGDCVDIFLNQANACNITEIVSFVTKLVDKFINTSNEPIKNIDQLDLTLSMTDLSSVIDTYQEKKSLIVNLNLVDTNILVVDEKINFNVIVKNANISITDKLAKKVMIDVLLNNYLVTRLQFDYISTTNVIIDMLHIYIDPEIFDQINYICGTLSSDPQTDSSDWNTQLSEEGLQQLREALYRSAIFNENTIFNEDLDSESKNDIFSTSNNVISDIPQIKFLTSSFTNLYSILIDEYAIETKQTEGLELKIFIGMFHCYFFDKLLVSDDKNKGSPAFLCAIFKDIEFKKIKESVKENINKPLISIYEKGIKQRPNYLDKYLLNIRTGALIDVQCRDPEWKYFIKFSKENMLRTSVIIHGDVIRSSINLGLITTNIREETLLRLLAFFSSSHHVPKNNNSLHIERFNIGSIDLIINYYPLIIKKINGDPNVFALKNFKIRLSPHTLTNIENFDKLTKLILEKIKEEINPDNILQFVPNIRIIQPYASPIVDFINLTKRYFNNPDNKRKIRKITKNINRGADIISALVKNNMEQVFDLFN